MRGAKSAAVVISAAAFSLISPTDTEAFDCAKATTKIEKAICASPAAKAADDKMGQAYTRLRDTISGPQRTALLNNQRAWLKLRNTTCGWREGDEISQCVEKETRKRADLLVGAPLAGPGTGRPMGPVFIGQIGNDERYDVNSTAIKFSSPSSGGERVYNGEIAQFLKDAPVDEKIDFKPPTTLSYSGTVRVTYASPRLISAEVSGWRYDGGAHGNSWIYGINVDLETGAEVSFGDLIQPENADGVIQACMDGIRKIKAQRSGYAGKELDEQMASHGPVITKQVQDVGSWTFHTDHALVHFAPYEIGAYAEGSFECKLPYDLLRPLARPGAPLPQ